MLLRSSITDNLLVNKLAFVIGTFSVRGVAAGDKHRQMIAATAWEPFQQLTDFGKVGEDLIPCFS